MMQNPVDDQLNRLAAMPTPGTLDAIEATVIAVIDENSRAHAAGRTLGMWSVGAALALGLIGGTGLAGTQASARAASPIGIDAALAPSTLLLGR